MAKHRNPLQSGQVSGKMDENRVFSTYKGQTYSKRFTPPKQPNTKAQKQAQDRMAWAVKLWQRWLPEEEREAWRGYSVKGRKRSPVTLEGTRPPGNTLFIRSAIQCKRAGFEPPHLPPRDPEPQPVELSLIQKGKGVLVEWDSDLSWVLGPSAKARSKGPLPKVELSLTVTSPWKKAYLSLFRALAIVPLGKGKHVLTPIAKDKRYSFLSRVITPDGQISRPSRVAFVLTG
jgi:hypothetical protein